MEEILQGFLQKTDRTDICVKSGILTGIYPHSLWILWMEERKLECRAGEMGITLWVTTNICG